MCLKTTSPIREKKIISHNGIYLLARPISPTGPETNENVISLLMNSHLYWLPFFQQFHSPSKFELSLWLGGNNVSGIIFLQLKIPGGCVPIFMYFHIYLLSSLAFCFAVLEEIAMASDTEVMRHTEDLAVILSAAARPWRGLNMSSAKHINSPDADRQPRTIVPVREVFRSPLMSWCTAQYKLNPVQS